MIYPIYLIDISLSFLVPLICFDIVQPSFFFDFSVYGPLLGISGEGPTFGPQGKLWQP